MEINLGNNVVSSYLQRTDPFIEAGITFTLLINLRINESKTLVDGGRKSLVYSGVCSRARW
jgi:hypothetical protein